MNNMEQNYENMYTDKNFQDVYRMKRNLLYHRISQIVLNLGIRQAIDAGCAYGQLVSHLNISGIDAWGIDFDIVQLREYHEQLVCRNKFLYGGVSKNMIDGILRNGDVAGLILLDTLRHVENTEDLADLQVEYILIKEVSNNRYIRRRRVNQPDARLYSPLLCVETFAGYRPVTLYATRFWFKLNHPSKWVLRLYNWIFPNYFLILKKK